MALRNCKTLQETARDHKRISDSWLTYRSTHGGHSLSEDAKRLAGVEWVLWTMIDNRETVMAKGEDQSGRSSSMGFESLTHMQPSSARTGSMSSSLVIGSTG